LYSWIAKWAIREQIPISFHAAESKAEEEFIGKRSGLIARALQTRAADWNILGDTSVEHLESTGIFAAKPLLAHLVQASSGDIEILAKHKVTVAHCPKSNAKFGHGIAPITELLDHGLAVGIGTDSAASNNRLDLFEEARFALLLQRLREGVSAPDEEHVLRMLTIEGARALGLDRQIGSLEPGKEADFVVLRIPSYYTNEIQVLRHLIHNVSSGDVIGTYIAGREVRVSVSPAAGDIYEKFREETS
jgi:5-methylthioadenosine/S-adenosylhomocysteine deaminase